jgi:phosphatidylserine decarboxylase
MFAITPYGRRLVAVFTAGILVSVAALAWLATVVHPLILLLALPDIALWLWVLWFFRDPERAIPQEAGAFVSPADGTVTDVTPLGPQSLLGCEGVQVGVFMSVFDVHVNRSPCDLRVTKIEHRSGTFLDVRRREAWESNESVTIHGVTKIGGREFPVVFRQIAGLVAKRIVTDLQVGQELLRGQRIGMIRFGSRGELLVPKELAAEVRVEIGRHVQAGATVLVARNKSR